MPVKITTYYSVKTSVEL